MDTNKEVNFNEEKEVTMTNEQFWSNMGATLQKVGRRKDRIDKLLRRINNLESKEENLENRVVKFEELLNNEEIDIPRPINLENRSDELENKDVEKDFSKNTRGTACRKESESSHSIWDFDSPPNVSPSGMNFGGCAVHTSQDEPAKLQTPVASVLCVTDENSDLGAQGSTILPDGIEIFPSTTACNLFLGGTSHIIQKENTSLSLEHQDVVRKLRSIETESSNFNFTNESGKKKRLLHLRTFRKPLRSVVSNEASVEMTRIKSISDDHQLTETVPSLPTCQITNRNAVGKTRSTSEEMCLLSTTSIKNIDDVGIPSGLPTPRKYLEKMGDTQNIIEQNGIRCQSHTGGARSDSPVTKYQAVSDSLLGFQAPASTESSEGQSGTRVFYSSHTSSRDNMPGADTSSPCSCKDSNCISGLLKTTNQSGQMHSLLPSVPTDISWITKPVGGCAMCTPGDVTYDSKNIEDVKVGETTQPHQLTDVLSKTNNEDDTGSFNSSNTQVADYSQNPTETCCKRYVPYSASTNDNRTSIRGTKNTPTKMVPTTAISGSKGRLEQMDHSISSTSETKSLKKQQTESNSVSSIKLSATSETFQQDQAMSLPCPSITKNNTFRENNDACPKISACKLPEQLGGSSISSKESSSITSLYKKNTSFETKPEDEKSRSYFCGRRKVCQHARSPIRCQFSNSRSRCFARQHASSPICEFNLPSFCNHFLNMGFHVGFSRPRGRTNTESETSRDNLETEDSSSDAHQCTHSHDDNNGNSNGRESTDLPCYIHRFRSGPCRRHR